MRDAREGTPASRGESTSTRQPSEPIGPPMVRSRERVIAISGLVLLAVALGVLVWIANNNPGENSDKQSAPHGAMLPSDSPARPLATGTAIESRPASPTSGLAANSSEASGSIVAGSANATPTSSPSPVTVVPTAPTEHLFTIPGGKGGIGVWYGTEGLYGVAAMSDGTFWVGDWTKTDTEIGGRLLHYSRSGQLLTATPAPGGSRDMAGMVRDLEAYGKDLWAIINRSVYEMAPDGRVVASYPLPDEIDSRPVVSPALLLAPGGEVLITANGPGSAQAPSANAQIVGAAGKQAIFTSDKSGKTDMPALPGYPGPAGSLYSAALDASGAGMGTIMIAGTQIAVKEPYPITALNILRVNRDGSLYVMAERDVGSGSGTNDKSGTSRRSEDARQTILLYGDDGQLKGRAVLPFAGHYIDVIRQTAIDDKGSVYVLYRSGRAEFSVARLNFYPPGVLPPMPFIATSTPTYSPPTPTPTPSDLQGLVTQAGAIADVEVTTAFTDTVITRVKKWLKPYEIQGYKGGDLYNASFLNVAGDPQVLKLLVKGGRYIIFLASPHMVGDCPQVPDALQLVAGNLGVFEVRGIRIGSAGGSA